jgi:hypothetical protein
MKTITASVLPPHAMGAEQGKNFCDWVWSIPTNFDPETVSYPRAVIAKASADGEPFMYVPVHPVLRFESLAPKPGTSKLQIAQGLREICRIVDQAAKQTGFAECEMLTNSEDEMKLCVKRGWYITLYDPACNTWLLRHKVQHS